VQESSFAKAAREKLEAARAQAIAGRADGRLSHVIVSARRAKKAADLTMASVPFPYTSAEQWEQEVAAPLVRERLTGASHVAAVRPRVVVPRGEAVQPLRMSIAATAERRRADKSGAIRRRGERAQARDSRRRGLSG
jgi:Utp14 protein